jgi:DNA polymerase-3 subunit alpha
MEMPDVDIDSEKSRREAIIEATRKKFGYDKVLNICAFRTEGSKAALLTTCRGMGVSSDVAQYLASLIPVIRGNTTSLHVMVNGDVENEIKPNTEFINECNKYEGLLDMAMTIEGLICGRTVHASGVIIFESPYTELNCMMRSPNGQPTTQWDMDDSAYAGGLKYDYLTITNLDSMHKCMDFLVEYGYIEWQGSLRETYNKYFHPDVLDYSSEDMWKMAENLEIVNLFQFMTTVGQQAIQKIKPRSLIELGVANSVMRLMAQDKGSEQPLDKYVRYKNNITEWYDTMKEYGLTDEEVSIMENHLNHVSGMATMQEEVMRLVMDERISNFDMVGANKLRKSIAKKKKQLQQEAKDNFYKVGKSVGASQNLLDYVWKECIVPQLGYSFSQPHVLGYSTIGVQEMNMAYKYPIIYWNCANLIVDSASDEEIEGATDYGKVGISISNMQEAGIDIALPLINEANFGFSPDEKHNRIIFGFKAMNGIGDDAARIIVENRPYSSMEDFCAKLIDTKLVKNSQMIKLIKGGCFTELHSLDRRITMEWYLRNYVFKPCENLTMQQFNKMKELEFIPESMDLPLRMINFKNYVLDDEGLYEKHINEGKKIPKKGYHDGYYILDNNSQPFFKQYFTEDSVVDIKGEYYIVSEKKFTKEVDSYIQTLKDWMALPSTLDAYNEKLFQELWNKHAEGSVPHWNMESLCYYDGEHELEHVKEETYGIVNFFDLPEEPEPYEWYTRYINGEPKAIPKYKISRIAGTVLQADSNHHLVTILTKYGNVNVKMNKGHYAFYNKTISEVGEDGKKKRLEESWLKRGNLIIVSGYRRDDQFRPLVYNDTIYKHTVNLIQEVHEDGTLLIQSERTRVNTEQN